MFLFNALVDLKLATTLINLKNEIYYKDVEVIDFIERCKILLKTEACMDNLFKKNFLICNVR